MTTGLAIKHKHIVQTQTIKKLLKIFFVVSLLTKKVRYKKKTLLSESQVVGRRQKVLLVGTSPLCPILKCLSVLYTSTCE